MFSGGRKDCFGGRPGDVGDRGGLAGVRLAATGEREDRGDVVWVALHGTVSLRTALPRFPWPDPAAFVRQLVLPLAKVTA